MNYMDYNCHDCKKLNDGHLKKIPAAYTWWDAGNVLEILGSLSPRTPYIR